MANSQLTPILFSCKRFFARALRAFSKFLPVSVVPSILFRHRDVPSDTDINHDNWQKYILDNFDREGFEILEVGSRVVTGSRFGQSFRHAHYTGFDYYEGENVDIAGDAHSLSSYFGDKRFDLIFSSAVFEHLAMPWKVSTEIIKLLKVGGYIFIETHYSFSSHERPWHFFQFSENALNVLFPQKFGIECVKKGCSNLLKGWFSGRASRYLRGRIVSGLYCHSEFLGRKVREAESLSWDNVSTEEASNSTKYPAPKK